MIRHITHPRNQMEIYCFPFCKVPFNTQLCMLWIRNIRLESVLYKMLGRCISKCGLHQVLSCNLPYDITFHGQEENTQETTYCVGHTPQSPPATINSGKILLCEGCGSFLLQHSHVNTFYTNSMKTSNVHSARISIISNLIKLG